MFITVWPGHIRWLVKLHCDRKDSTFMENYSHLNVQQYFKFIDPIFDSTL